MPDHLDLAHLVWLCSLVVWGPGVAVFSSNFGVLTCWKTEKLKFIKSLGQLQCCFAEIVFLVDFVKTRCECCFVQTGRTFSLFALHCLSLE